MEGAVEGGKWRSREPDATRKGGAFHTLPPLSDVKKPVKEQSLEEREKVAVFRFRTKFLQRPKGKRKARVCGELAKKFFRSGDNIFFFCCFLLGGKISELKCLYADSTKVERGSDSEIWASLYIAGRKM